MRILSEVLSVLRSDNDMDAGSDKQYSAFFDTGDRTCAVPMASVQQEAV